MIGSISALVNLVGYLTGAMLYALLLFMAVGEMRRARAAAFSKDRNADQARATDEDAPSPDGLPLLTACLGIMWNLGSLTVWGLESSGNNGIGVALVKAGTFAALGFLPAVALHSVLRQSTGWRAEVFALGLVVTAYACSATASTMHLSEAMAHQIAPSHWGLHLLTWGFGTLTIAVLWHTHRRAQQWRSIGWVVALGVFAVSASHLSHHEGTHYPWWMELLGHHASLALILAILYQDYRFALADIFLKRALTLTSLIAVIAAAQHLIVWPLGQARWRNLTTDTFIFGVTLALWLATALLTPLLWRLANWFVDSVILKRVDYESVRQALAAQLAECMTIESSLTAATEQLARALTAKQVRWEIITTARNADLGDGQFEGQLSAPPFGGMLLPLVEPVRARASAAFPHAEPSITARAMVPTSEVPHYQLLVGKLAGGRRLLSDDLALLAHASLLTARRIDALRVTHERCARDLAEEEMRKLAVEAELRALRAQLNPHFLFNALTTIGYLIQAAPTQALDTLLRLTTLLRGVLNRTSSEFVTLGEELDLIAAYLDIERARFEDRLRVIIDVPIDLREARLPVLLIQPLVENAIKHGITPARHGGELVIRARQAADCLQITVRDTGLGASTTVLQAGRGHGLGLASVEQRLQAHYGKAATFKVHSAPALGFTVELSLPLTLATLSSDNVADFATAALRRKQA